MVITSRRQRHPFLSVALVILLAVVGVAKCDDDSAFAAGSEETKIVGMGREATEALGGVVPIPAIPPRERVWKWTNPPIPEVFPESEIPGNDAPPEQLSQSSCLGFELMVRQGDICA